MSSSSALKRKYITLLSLRTLSVEIPRYCRSVLLAPNDAMCIRDISCIIVQLEVIKGFRDSCNYADIIFEFDYYADIYP